ncbi:MAG: amino acid adenylation domain-containing protein, partial [Proteobacteria bacterium]|nr:amino acid adenylation domain-containing protein [Pseudomonadota bacterium]
MTESRSAITEGPRTVHDMLAHVGRRQADHTALVYRGQSLRYGELLARARTMAKTLRAAGVAPSMVVGIALPRSIDAIVTVVAILEAGAAYLPLDPSYPTERTEHMLRDAGACLVVTLGAHAARFASLAPLLVLDAPGPSPLALATPTQPHALAYVMYTSGSTGAPRGIGIPHAAILRLVIAPNFMHLGPDTRMLQAAPLGFDASTLEIWGPLLNGGVCVLHDEDLPTPKGLARTIRNHQVNSAWLTAALFNSVVDAGPEHLEGLAQLLSGGEALSVRHVRRALQALPETRLINGYGPTECTTFATAYTVPHELSANARSVPIGKPINATTVHVLDTQMQPVQTGEVGELYVGGAGLGMGYLNRHELTAERFIPNPFNSEPGARLYRTGDLVRQLADGNLDYIGRVDAQVKIRGLRIEPGEIEARLAEHAAVRSCAVIARADAAGGTRLLAYVVPRDQPVAAAELRAHLSARLPDYMVPAAFTWLPALPVTPNGKLDARALPEPDASRPDLATRFEAAHTPLEARLCEVFAQTLGLEQIGRLDNFFDLGGNSLLVLRVLALLGGDGEVLGTNAFFSQPTPAALAARLLEAKRGDAPAAAPRFATQSNGAPAGGGSEAIAIIAVAGRFPGAADVEALWQMLVQGRDGITHFTDAELDPSIPPAVRADPSYVKARGVVDGVEYFDAAFFGIPPREAQLMDPQQRIFLELCWECLERAGHAPDATTGPVGVFAGMHNATYFQNHVQHRPDLVEALGAFQVMLGNEKDYIANRVANRLNLTGPAVAVNSACSTSLVAVAQAVLALRAGQCEMALAGGSSINCPPRSGYLYQDGAMLSPDGATRTFSADAQGTVFSDGAAVVLLKRLIDAQRDGNPILAVIRGVAVNNDGRDKASFTAPSVDGQAAVVTAALRDACLKPCDIDYVEAHGTATPLGDPVEVEALARALKLRPPGEPPVLLGSLKSNVGHMVIAAGAGSVIKTALALAHETIPPSIHFSAPNPRIDFARGGFAVCSALTPWPRGARPRRAGISGFGVGGTNAHVVVEEAPPQGPSAPAVGPQLLLLSARSTDSLQAQAEALARHLDAHPDINLADCAHTLQVGRSAFTQRLAVVAPSSADCAQALRESAHAARVQRSVPARRPALVWMFSGQGAQYPGMGRGLYAADRAFRAGLDEAIAAFAAHLDFDLKAAMFDSSPERLAQTAITQPALFSLEYALAQAWRARGAQPAALIGHSVGEFVCAVLAGVMSLADCSRLVARRGALMQEQPAGAMLSVRLPVHEVLARMPQGLALAADNAPRVCVVAGPVKAIAAFQAELAASGVQVQVLRTSHAFHSPMMDGALESFAAALDGVTLGNPSIPIASTCSGDWLTGEHAVDPAYWVRQ